MIENDKLKKHIEECHSYAFYSPADAFRLVDDLLLFGHPPEEIRKALKWLDNYMLEHWADHGIYLDESGINLNAVHHCGAPSDVLSALLGFETCFLFLDQKKTQNVPVTES